jgi:Putative transposase
MSESGCRPKYLLPVKVLSRLFRPLMLEMLVAAHDAGRLQFFGDHAHLADKAAFKAYLAPLHRIKWFVHCKRPFAGPAVTTRVRAEALPEVPPVADFVPG